jgi:hypothetical protein
MTELQTYGDFSPTPFDPKGRFLDGDKQEWLVAPCGQNRDSEALTRSNYETQLAELEKLDPEWETFEEHRFGHWGPGWFEIVIVKPESPAHYAALEIAKSMEDYPVLDEDDFCQKESDEAQETWEFYSMRDRIELCSEAGVSIFAARRDCPPHDDQGYIQERLLGH